MRTIPNMTVIVPADGPETEAAVRAAVEIDGPVYLRLGRLGVPVIFDENYKFQLGKAVTIKEGTACTVFACGLMTGVALEAWEILQAEGIQVKLVNMPTIKPIDKEAIISAARETGAIVTAEEHSIIGGLGGAVAEVLVENSPVPMERVGIQDTFGESGTPAALLEKYGLTAKEIVGAVKRVMARK